MQSSVVIDGTHGEGGGALVRTTLVLAALTQQSVRIENVRGGTRYPGLDAEDITLAKILREMTLADTSELSLGAAHLAFSPKRNPRRPRAMFETDRNGSGRGASAPILLCALAPVMATMGTFSELTITGETFGPSSLSVDAFFNGTLPLFEQIGLYAQGELVRAGWGRESNGRMKLEVEPGPFTGLIWNDRGAFEGLTAKISTSRLPRSVADRAESHLKQLARHSKLELEVDSEEVSAEETGAAVTVVARYRHGMGTETKIGTRGLRIESVAQSAFDGVFDWMTSDANLDPYLADHILLPLALASSPSEFKVARLTQRFLTQVWVIKQLSPARIVVRGVQDAPGHVAIAR